jgi:hypothetical protein
MLTVPPNPCEPPCWYEIVPGQTSFAEAEEIVAALPFVHEYWVLAYRYDDRRYKFINWTQGPGTANEPTIGGSVVTRDRYVVDIELHHPPPLLTVDEVIGRYGDPQSARAYFAPGIDLLRRVALWYPAEGLIFHAEATDGYAYDAEADEYVSSPCLDAASTILEMNYIVQAGLTYEEMRWLNLLGGASGKELVQWPGLGCALYEP